MSDADAETAISVALQAVNILLGANPGPTGSTKDALSASQLQLSLALGAIALKNFRDAANAVAAAAANLKAITDGTAAPALAKIATAQTQLPAVSGGGPGPISPGPANPPGTETTITPGGSQPAPQTGAGFPASAAIEARGQWDFFGKQTYDINGHKTVSGHHETEPNWSARIAQYWLFGTGQSGIDGTTPNHPWSAAFISWVMKTAGAGNRFNYSGQHSVYISRSIRDFNQSDVNAGYWGRRLNDHKPAVGDLVCWGRQPGVDYDHQMGGNYHGHSDLIVEVGPETVTVIGGNVGQSCTLRPLALDANGFVKPIVQHGENLFGIMQCRIA